MSFADNEDEEHDTSLAAAVKGDQVEHVANIVDGQGVPHAGDLLSLALTHSPDGEMVATLLRAKASTRTRKGQDPYLFKCLATESADIKVKVLLAAGADPNELGSRGQTIFEELFLAAPHNSGDIVLDLLTHGADPNITGQSGNTPVFALFANTDVNKNWAVKAFEHLVDFGARCTEDGRSVKELLKEELATRGAGFRAAFKKYTACLNNCT